MTDPLTALERGLPDPRLLPGRTDTLVRGSVRI